MHIFGRWVPACAVAALITVQPNICLSQHATVGNITASKNKVHGVVGSRTASIAEGARIYTNEVLRTGRASAVDLKFLNDSTTTLGPVTEARLDKFVYEPGESGAVVIEATKGAFRFVTGKKDEKAYQIRTPYGTLDIRG